MRSTMKRIDRRSFVLAAGLAVPAALCTLWLYRADSPAPPMPGLPPAAPPPVGAAVVPPAAPSTEGLRLYGVLGEGAIIGGAQGGQRLIPVGREVAPGLRLERVELHRVTLAWSAGTVELTLDGRHPATSAAPTAPPLAQPESRREETLRYRLGLEPRRVDGRITGFAVRSQADLPLLRRAGLRPGDVLIAVNGQSFDSEEKLNELPSEIAGSFTAEFEFERGGRRMRASLPVNSRT